jgi:hypothetical protein
MQGDWSASRSVCFISKDNGLSVYLVEGWAGFSVGLNVMAERRSLPMEDAIEL